MRNLNMLLSILNLNRHAGGDGEKHAIKTYLDSIFGMQTDGYGNRFIEVLHPDGERPTTMFSCHTDTVHTPKAALYSKIALDEHKNHIMSAEDNCLGADDGVGMYLMIQMINEGVPGYYVFHREEEVGGGGSTYAAKHHDIKHIQRAVAFDRKGYSDIITYQFGGNCASKEFAAALAIELEKSIPSKWSEADGTFTDTANYAHIIPECTNISVGYFHQHTKDEYLDLDFVAELEEALMRVDWEALPTVRDPLAEAYWDDWDDYDYRHPTPRDYDYNRPNSTFGPDWFKLVDVVKRYPEAVADILFDLNIDHEEVLDEAAAN